MTREVKYNKITPSELTPQMAELLYQEGCFGATVYNGGDDTEDLNFLIFAHKKAITGKRLSYKQMKRFDHIVEQFVLPFLEAKANKCVYEPRTDYYTRELGEVWTA